MFNRFKEHFKEKNSYQDKRDSGENWQMIEDVGVGVEVMSSPSACRTYNVLLSEDRRVAAALFPIRGV